MSSTLLHTMTYTLRKTYIQYVHTVVCCAYGLLFLLITMYVCTFRIGKATGYKLSELSGLVEGSTLIIGGKQIEVNLHYIHTMYGIWD